MFCTSYVNVKMPKPRLSRQLSIRRRQYLDVPSPSTSTPDINGNDPWQWSRSRSGNVSSASSLPDLTDFSGYESEQQVPETVQQCPVDHSTQGRELVNATFPCDVDTLFTLLFTGSTFLTDFHTSRKTFDIEQSEWVESRTGDGSKTRKVSFTVTLTQALGPKHSYLSEVQTMVAGSRQGHLYSITTEVNNGGIPYADSFYVTTHYCLTRANTNSGAGHHHQAQQQQSNLKIMCDVKFRKSVWMAKGFIERGTWDGMVEFYGHLERALREECSSSTHWSSSYSMPVSVGVVTPRPRRKKRPAPPAPCTPQASTDVADEHGSRRGSKVVEAAASDGIVSVRRYLTAITSFSWDLGNILRLVLIILTAGVFILHVLIYVKIRELELSLGPSTLPLLEAGIVQVLK